MKGRKFTGVMPALITPLLEDETVNVGELKRLIAFQSAQGADGFYVGGATGEGIALRREVREVLAEESVKAVGGKVPVIVHIASADFSEAVALAKHAEKVGADAISAIPPLFYPYGEQDVLRYYGALADAVSIPLIIYFNPNAGFTVNAEFAAKAFGSIGNVTGIKWTSSDYFGMVRLKELTHGEMNVINGPDEMLLMGLSAGADGGIGTTYNFMLPTIKRVYRAFMRGDIPAAQAAQTEADKIIKALLVDPVIPATKAVLEKMGFAVGNSVFPMRRFTEEEKEAIAARLRDAGFVFPA